MQKFVKVAVAVCGYWGPNLIRTYEKRLYGGHIHA